MANDFVLALIGYHPDYPFLESMGIEIEPEKGRPVHDPETLETTVPGLYVAGGMVSGRETNKIFIENGRFHGGKIVSSPGRPTPGQKIMLGSHRPRRIRIRSGELSFSATLTDNRAARALWKRLPVEAKASTWGHEIYFPVPVELAASKEDKDVVGMGDIAYCLPAARSVSSSARPPPAAARRSGAASPVTVLGKVEGDPTLFNAVEDGQLVRLEREEA